MQHHAKTSNYLHYLSYFVCAAWAAWVILDYLVHHPYTTNALTSVPYAGLLGFYGVLCVTGGLWVWWKKRKEAATVVAYRGGMAYLAVLGCGAAALLAFSANPFVPEVATGIRLGYFALTATGYALGLFFLVTVAYVSGEWMLRPLGLEKSGGFRLPAIALGFSIIGFTLVLLGLFNLLHPYVLWPLLIGVLGLRYRVTGNFLHDVLWQKRKLSLDNWWAPAAWLLLFAILGLNLVAAFKPFPIGYDGSALYVNLAGLVADYGGLPYGGQAFNWSVMMSLGEILFGRLTMTILIAHGMSVLCVLLLYQLARLWLRPGFAVLAVLIPLVSPYFSFHAFIDEKVDLAFTFIILAGFYLAAKCLGARPPVRGKEQERGETKLRFFGGRWQPTRNFYLALLLGWLAGYAFGIKYTAVLYVLALAGWWCYVHGGKRVFFAAASGALGLVFTGGIYRFSYLEIGSVGALVIGLVGILAGVGGFLFIYRNRRQELTSLVGQLSAIALAAGLAFAPWAWKHGSEQGNFSPAHLIEGKANGPALNFLPRYSELLPSPGFHARFTDYRLTDERPSFRFAAQNQAVTGRNASAQGAREEIQRYLGFEAPFWRYASLPYDLTTNVNIPNSRHLDLGFLFLLLLPLLLLLRPGRQRPLWQSLLLLLGLIGYLAGTYYSVYALPGEAFDANRVSEGISAGLSAQTGNNLLWYQSLYITAMSPLLWLAERLALLFALLGLQPAWAVVVEMTAAFGLVYLVVRQRIVSAATSFRALAGFTALYGLLWWLLGSGILWYALPLFVLFPVVLLYFFDEPGRFLGPAAKTFSSVFGGLVIGGFLLVQTLTYFTSAYPGDVSQEGIFRWPFVDVMSNPAASSGRAIDLFNPVVGQAMAIINGRPEAKVYRVNTHFSYFIDRNDTRVYSDPVLEGYDRITRQLNEPDHFFDMLYAQGYRYILFDLKTGALDQTPEKSLYRKFTAITGILTESDKVRVLLTDNYIADPAAPAVRLLNGQTVNARYGIHGQTVQMGNIALFEVLPPATGND